MLAQLHFTQQRTGLLYLEDVVQLDGMDCSSFHISGEVVVRLVRQTVEHLVFVRCFHQIR